MRVFDDMASIRSNGLAVNVRHLLRVEQIVNSHSELTKIIG